MAPKGRGGGETPKNLVRLVREALANSSQSAIARETGLTQSAIGRYSKGEGEPSQSTLEKLAKYFNVSVPYLRGEVEETLFTSDRAGDCVERISYNNMKLYEKYGNESEIIENMTLCLELMNIINETQKNEAEKAKKAAATLERFAEILNTNSEKATSD
ncbi:XRE family transcriptional regulator [Geomonas terrae]|uniref:XRE family transcriptional regulator n=1 Tax=Geomonas terrae TaxID=2562681 RepID=A0A4S1CMN9_9BACT|nr:helix-turn-helix transcriptional regulator [Geomonas terrae]TGU75098.1 XRE family transcriptional regulator [Geomonas terrae]